MIPSNSAIRISSRLSFRARALLFKGTFESVNHRKRSLAATTDRVDVVRCRENNAQRKLQTVVLVYIQVAVCRLDRNEVVEAGG